MSNNTKGRNYRYNAAQAAYEEEYEKRRRQAHRKYMVKKKKKRRRRRIFFFFFLLVSILTGYGVARMQVEITNTLNIVSRNAKDDLNDVDVSNIDLVGDDEVINILLVGSDKRATDTTAGRSDSLMIATLDMKNKQIKLSSIMRDTLVTIPGYMDNRFNASYSYGGIPLLYQTIATNFKVRLDGYVLVDFEAFTNVIDELGGVDISITQSEYDHLISYYKNKSYKKDVEKLSPGMNTMTGRQALCYARIRKEGNGDFRRTERQREVLQAIFTKAKSMSLTTLYDTMKSVLPYVETDFTNEEIISMLTSLFKMGTTEIEQFRIPVDGTYENQKVRGMAVLVADLEENASLLQEFIYNKVDSTTN